jgi:hypothetical protein
MDIDRLRHLAGQSPINEMGPEDISAAVAEIQQEFSLLKERIAEIAPELGLDDYELTEMLNDLDRISQEFDSL